MARSASQFLKFITTHNNIENSTEDSKMEETKMQIDEPTPVPVSRQSATVVSETSSTSLPDNKPLAKCEPMVPPASQWNVSPLTGNIVSYPSILSYDFRIASKKRVDRYLDVYYCGIKDPVSKRRWAFTIGAPKCYVQFASSAFETEPPN